MKNRFQDSQKPLYLLLISVHGLIRGNNLELGRDADTGGQTKYVVELARALGRRAEVDKVDLLTRRIIDDQVSSDYAEVFEPLSTKAAIVRIECGGKKYLAKEMLWDSLDNFADNILFYLKSQGRIPDVIHSHYADAGYVGSRLAHQLGVPLVHTGHSLGRNKRQRLVDIGMKPSVIEATYKISRRIEAEETTLGVADCVITSSQQEIEEQYGLYDFYQPQRMRVVPPGTDLAKFYPARGSETDSEIASELNRFLQQPDKPIILALSRPDPRKNIVALIEAYGQSSALQEVANLVIVAGSRDDILEMESISGNVLNDILLAIDKYDLYGKVAYPKQHQPDDVAVLYRLAASRRGVFINPALTEPFGLTLLEAAACGLPIVATEDGGPSDIIMNCRNGHLVNPLDKQAMVDTLCLILTNPVAWRRMAKNGLQGVRRHYSWQAHVDKYLAIIRPLAKKIVPISGRKPDRRPGAFTRAKAIFTSLDLNLIGDEETLSSLLRLIGKHRQSTLFGIATGRRFDDLLAKLSFHDIPQPDVVISGLGTAVHHPPNLTKSVKWQRHIDHLWHPQKVEDILSDIPGLTMQPQSRQGAFKISYYIDPGLIDPQEIRRVLLRAEQTVNTIFSFGQYLDVLPIRASKGLALRWCAAHLGFSLNNTLVAGATGADGDMLRGNTLAAVVENRHRLELAELADIEGIYFANRQYAAGILEALAHYRFFADEERR